MTPLLGFFFSGPLTTLATLAGAVSIPVIIHLLNRRRYRIVTWAAMRFLLAAEKKNARRIRVEQLLLLMLRVLMVLLLILAMASVTNWAQEFWARNLPEGSILTSGTARTHRILVIDGSASMGQRPGETTCFEKARAIAREIVQKSQRGDGFSILLMASTPRKIIGGTAGPAEDPSKVLAGIDSLRQTAGNSDLAATFQTVADLVRLTPGKFDEKEVYFLSDLQQATWRLPQPGVIASAFQTLKSRGARSYIINVGGTRPPPDNLAVAGLRLGLPVAVPGIPCPLLAIVHNYAAEGRQATLTLRVGRASGKPGEPAFALRAIGQKKVHLSRGANAVAFEHLFTTPGEYAVQVSLDGDALDLDDTFSMVLSVRDTVQVLLVNGKPAADRYETATEYLYDALNPWQDQPPPAFHPVRVRKIAASDFSDAGLGSLDGVDCVFVCDVPRFGRSEVSRLESHVRRGGGVVLSVGPGTDWNAWNDALHKGGQGLMPALLRGRETAPRNYCFRFAEEKDSFRAPPLLAFVDEERDRERLLSATFHGILRAEIPSVLPQDSIRRLLSFIPAREADGPGKVTPFPGGTSAEPRPPALLDWQPLLTPPPAPGTTAPPPPPSRGRVILLNTSVNTDWTDWPRQGNFVWLMQELMYHAASGRLREQIAHAGDTLEGYLDGPGEDREVRVVTPDKRTERVRASSREDATLWRLADADLAGVYVATVTGQPREYLFAVNVPPANQTRTGSESDLSRISKQDLEKQYPDWTFQLAEEASEISRVASARGLSTETQKQMYGTAIAHWLLWAVLLLLVAEVILAWYFGRFTAVHERDRSTSVWNQGRFGDILRWVLRGSIAFLGVFTLVAGFALLHAAWTGDFLGFLPTRVREGLEEAWKIPPPAPGEGRRWHLEFRSYIMDPESDIWLAGALAIAAAMFVVLIYRREIRAVEPPDSAPTSAGGDLRPLADAVDADAGWLPTFVARLGLVLASILWRGGRSRSLLLLAGLRLGFILLMLAVLMPQLRLWFERQAWPDVVLILDDSASMGEEEGNPDAQVQELAKRLQSEAGLTRKERLALAKVLISRGQADWITRILTERQIKVHVYRCSGRASHLGSATRPDEAKKLLEDIKGLQARAEHDSSQIGNAIRQVLNDFRGSSLAGVILFTDGAVTEGESLADAAKYAAQMKVPLFFVGLGDNRENKNLILQDVKVAGSVFVGDNLVFQGKLIARGFNDQAGKKVKVLLREKARAAGQKDSLLQEKELVLRGNTEPIEFRFEWRAREAGEKTFIVEVPVEEGEVALDDNTAERDVTVVEIRTLKVLYVEGYARWEYRYLKTLLERESRRLPNNKTMELKAFLQEPELAKAELRREQDRTLLPHLPTRDQLMDRVNGYDVVILGDIDPNPGENSRMPEFLKDLVDFVREKGGGLLLVAGERSAPHKLRDSPLRDILPIDVTSDRPPAEPETGRGESYRYRPELTPVGRRHPIFSFNAEDGEPIWKSLQPMYWWAEGYLPKRGAEVLAVHPTRKAEGGEVSRENRHALVVQHFVGAGRTLFYGFGESWRWRWREDEGRYNTFWIHTVRWLARPTQGKVELRLNKQTPYLRGEPIEVTVRYPDDAPPPSKDLDVRVVAVNRDSGEKQTLKLSTQKGSRGTFVSLMTRTPPGQYEFTLERPSVSGTQPRTSGKVLAPPGEKQARQMMQEDMERAARETKGGFYNLGNAEKLLTDLPSGSRVTVNAPAPPWLLWNHALLVVVALLFLATEWVLRKQKSLL